MPLSVSVVIPACNAAATLAETLDSLLAQTSPHWEAIIVENGSTDTTAEIAGDYCARDSRFRLHAMSERGVSRARNAGLSLARQDWVLFLDADDWIVPQHLAAMTGALAAHPQWDAVHCGWARVTNDRAVMWQEFGPTAEDLYPHLARTCTFAIHACVARRSAIVENGGFDVALSAGEDWDLWLRLARAGARFGQVRQVLAHYRARVDSASMDATRLFGDSLVVLQRAFAADPRVPRPIPAYQHGLPQDERPVAVWQNIVWAAGLAIGRGQETEQFLRDLTAAEVAFDPVLHAHCLHGAVATARGQPLSMWAESFTELAPAVEAFLSAMEKIAAKPGLARCTYRQLERLILEHAERSRPFTLATTQAVEIELTAPIPEFRPPPGIERLHCRLRWDGDRLGDLEVAVIDGVVESALLADAIAAEFAWPLLGRFLARTLYPAFTYERETAGWTVRREGRILARGLPGETAPDWQLGHDTFGWTVFLQEAWGLPALADDELYSLSTTDQARFAEPTEDGADPWLMLELSDRPRDRWITSRQVNALLSVGGIPIARKKVTGRGRLTARALRVAFTIETGFELCRACVREGILGQPAQTGVSLRERLAAAARRRARLNPPRRGVAAVLLAPTSSRALAETIGSSSAPLVVWPQRRFAPCDSPLSRRAALPHALLSELETLCGTTREPLLRLPGPAGAPPRVLHAPEVFWQQPPPPVRKGAAPGEETSRGYDGEFFEGLFATQADPWKYSTPYEQTKYEQTLELLPARRFEQALEVACAEGHFTVQLAPRVGRLLATDVSRTALARTRDRCAAHQNIEYQQLDLLQDDLRGRFDLIVCSEVLYYTGSMSALTGVARKLAGALREGGFLVAAHAHVVVDEPDRPGFTWDVPFGGKVIGEVLARTSGLQLYRELRTPLYRIQVFQRQNLLRRAWRRTKPERTILEHQPAPLEPDVAAHVLWQEDQPGAERTVTTSLPILMYHRVAEDGPAALARYRVTPAQFEAQLAHLQAAGYTSARFEEWRRAIATKRPLPGRRVVLTFDDGYRDFITTAWPLLKKYGFDATVYLPTALIGKGSEWDRALGEPAPLMNWDEILQLDREGVQFGSHTVTHPLLTSLAPAEIAAELLRSRALLQDYLGERVVGIAYPFGDSDPVVQSLAAACGYLFGVTCEDRLCSLHEKLLTLPRLEVKGGMKLEQFRERLGENPALSPTVKA